MEDDVERINDMADAMLAAKEDLEAFIEVNDLAPRPVLIDPVLMAVWATRDGEGNLLRWEWRQADTDGFWSPTVTVVRTDNLVRAERARIRAEVEALPSGCHSHSGLMCEDDWHLDDPDAGHCSLVPGHDVLEIIERGGTE
jgi:hypothetical protein